MSDQTKNTNSNVKKSIFENGYVQFLGVILLGAVITFFIWRSGLILNIFEKLNVSKEDQLRLILKHNRSPLVFYFMFGFGIALISFFIKEIVGFITKKDEDQNEEIE